MEARRQYHSLCSVAVNYANDVTDLVFIPKEVLVACCWEIMLFVPMLVYIPCWSRSMGKRKIKGINT